MSGPRDTRPEISEAGALFQKVNVLEAAINEHDDGIFQRVHDLVVVIGADEDYAQSMLARGIEVHPGTPVIAGLAPAALNDRLSSRVRYLRFDGRSESWKEGSPSRDVAASLFARKQWKSIRPIVALTETPAMHLDDGTIQSEGYDPKTGFLIRPAAPLPSIPDSPTIDDARAALAVLRKPFAEFPYQTEADRDVPIALALTVLFRPSLPAAANVPGFLIRAPQKNCGKSLAVKGACILGEGRMPASTTWSDDHGEQEKAVGAAADAGLRVLFFDNVPDELRIGGAAVDKRLTCSGRDQFRVLGRSELKPLDWRTVVVFTAKRAKFSGDADRRFVVCEMQRPDEKPATYAIDNVEAYVLEHRASLLAAAYTLARAWIREGRPSKVRRVDSFEPWSQTIPAMIHYAGGSDVTQCVHDGHDGTESDDDSSESEKAFLAHLHSFIVAHDGAGVTIKDHILPILYADPTRREHGESPPWKSDGFAWHDLVDSIAALGIRCDRDGKPDARALGDKLRAMKNVRHGDFRLVAGKKLNSNQRWAVARLDIGMPADPAELNGTAALDLFAAKTDADAAR